MNFSSTLPVFRQSLRARSWANISVVTSLFVASMLGVLEMNTQHAYAADGFAASATYSSPRTTGTTITSTASVTSVSTMSNVLVYMEINDASGAAVQKQGYFSQTLSSSPKQYDIRFTPTSAGTYTTKVMVFSNDWKTLHWGNPYTGSVAVTNAVTTTPTPTPTPNPTPAPVPVTGSFGATGSFGGTLVANTPSTATVNLTGPSSASNVVIDVEVYDAQGTRVAQNYISGQTLGATSKPYSVSFTPTANNTYSISVGVFSSDWANNMYWKNGVATAKVGATSTTPDTSANAYSASAAPVSGTVGAPVTSTVVVRAPSQESNVIVDIEVFDANGTRVAQKYYDGVSLTSAPQNYTVTFTPAAAGTYTIQTGVFTANWAKATYWQSNAGTITVANGSSTGTGGTTPTQPATGSFSAKATTVAATAGSSTPINVSIQTPTSVSSVIVDLEVYDSNGNKVAQKVFENESLSTTSKSYAMNFTPSVAGTYTIQVGVFTAGWAKAIHWESNAGKVTASGSTGTGTTNPPVSGNGVFHTVGTQIIGPDGKPFVAVGANLGSMGLMDQNGTAIGHSQDALGWGWNTVRIILDPVISSSSFIGQNGRAAFYANIDTIVQEYTSKKIVVILDAHGNGTSIADYRQFLSDMAAKYKNNTYVWFNVMNEPPQINQQWVSVNDQLTGAVRAQGAQNIVIVDAPTWGQDIGGGHPGYFDGAWFAYDSRMAPAIAAKYGNVVLSQHNYGAFYQYTSNATYAAYVDRVHAAGIPLLSAEFGFTMDGSTTAGFYDQNHWGGLAVFAVNPTKGVGTIWWNATGSDKYSLKADGSSFYSGAALSSNLSEAGKLLWNLGHPGARIA